MLGLRACESPVEEHVLPGARVRGRSKYATCCVAPGCGSVAQRTMHGYALRVLTCMCGLAGRPPGCSTYMASGSSRRHFMRPEWGWWPPTLLGSYSLCRRFPSLYRNGEDARVCLSRAKRPCCHARRCSRRCKCERAIVMVGKWGPERAGGALW